jgi:hypothetical protein
MSKQRYVLSKRKFHTIKEVEKLVNGWYGSGDLEHGTRLFKVVETYDLKLKFVKRKDKK